MTTSALEDLAFIRACLLQRGGAQHTAMALHKYKNVYDALSTFVAAAEAKDTNLSTHDMVNQLRSQSEEIETLQAEVTDLKKRNKTLKGSLTRLEKKQKQKE